MSEQMIIADQTGVPEQLRGTGVGLAPVLRRVEDARAEAVQIIPLCPFVNAQRRHHPEWAGVFKV